MKRSLDCSDASRCSANKALPLAKKARSVSLSSLDPFCFFIQAPPIAYAQAYSPLSDYMEGLVNGDFTVSQKPFLHHEHLSWLFCSADWLEEDMKMQFKDYWSTLERTLARADTDQISVPQLCFSRNNTVKSGDLFSLFTR